MPCDVHWFATMMGADVGGTQIDIAHGVAVLVAVSFADEQKTLFAVFTMCDITFTFSTFWNACIL